MHTVSYLTHLALSYIPHLGPSGWLLGLFATLGVGVICLRGFGSRSSF